MFSFASWCVFVDFFDDFGLSSGLLLIAFTTDLRLYTGHRFLCLIDRLARVYPCRRILNFTPTMSDTFVKADSRNLPKVETVMIMEYISTSNHHSIAEIRGAKILMSSRDSYVDTAVGYVKVSRTGSECTVKAKIVPEHRISKKLYTVTCNIDEHNDVIIDSVCEDCAASAGGCKHSLLLLFWLAKKSSEPSSTAVECYWNKPTLSSASTEQVTTLASNQIDSSLVGAHIL